MSINKVPESPVFPAGEKWVFQKRPGIYESDITAMVRQMLQDETIRADQRSAWERWRNDPAGLK
jgi:hypothetical protein